MFNIVRRERAEVRYYFGEDQVAVRPHITSQHFYQIISGLEAKIVKRKDNIYTAVLNYKIFSLLEGLSLKV